MYNIFFLLDIIEINRPFSPMLSVSVVSIIDDESVESTSVEVSVENHLSKVNNNG